jgi:hypothetical protein
MGNALGDVDDAVEYLEQWIQVVHFEPHSSVAPAAEVVDEAHDVVAAAQVEAGQWLVQNRNCGLVSSA